ncbi:unnamed protein product [Prunus armeniaca]
MSNCNPVQNPIVPGFKITRDAEGESFDSTYYKQIIGSLMYLTATRPDIMYVVSLLSRFMETPTELHYLAAKRVLRYLKGTVDYGLFYKKGKSNELVGFSDSDYAGDLEDRKSTSSHVFMLSSGAVSWSSKKQQVVTLSTTEAEFIAAASCACQAVWLRRILEELHCIQKKPTLIYCDNSSTIKLSKNPVLHGRSKHIDVRFHFLRDLTKAGVVDLVHCQSQDQIADILTKPLKLEAFEKLRGLLGVLSGSTTRDMHAVAKIESKLRSERDNEQRECGMSGLARPELVPIDPVRLDGKNYPIWARRMEFFLKELKVEYDAEEKWIKDDFLCLRTILNYLCDDLLHRYGKRKKTTTAKQLWDDLKLMFGMKKYLVRKYMDFQKVDEKSLVEQIQEFNRIFDEVVASGMTLSETFHVSAILSSLPLGSM